MENILDESDLSIIKNMMLNKTHKAIADFIEKPVEQIATAIALFCADGDIISYQAKLDEQASMRKALRPPVIKKTIVKPVQRSKKEETEKQKLTRQRQEEKEAIRRQRNNINQQVQRDREQRRQPAFKTKQVDYSKMISVKIDEKTTIFVHPGDDIDKLKKRYQKMLIDNKEKAYKIK